jgi:hypothetical protein
MPHFAPVDVESRPVSRVLSRAIIPLRSTSPWTSSGLPGSARGSALRALLPEPAASLFGLAPGGVCHASLVTKAAVRSYRTVSPLPSLASPRELGRFTFCCTFRGLAPPRRYLAPDPPEPGLSSPPKRSRGSDCPAGSPGHYTGQSVAFERRLRLALSQRIRLAARGTGQLRCNRGCSAGRQFFREQVDRAAQEGGIDTGG